MVITEEFVCVIFEIVSLGIFLRLLSTGVVLAENKRRLLHNE